jgi:hypothetical protein
MGIFDKFRKKSPKSELKQLLEMQAALHAAMSDGGGVDADELPNGVGPFGFDPNNPIPCKTTLGSMAYLERLHTVDGVKVQAERIGSFGSEVVNSPIDGYKLTHPNGADLGTIFISPYQGRISKKAPEGFKLI